VRDVVRHPGTVIGVAFIRGLQQAPLVLTGTFMILLLAYFIRRLPYSVRPASAILHRSIRGRGGVHQLGRLAVEKLARSLPPDAAGIVSGEF